MAELSYRPWREGDDLALLQVWGDAEGSGDDRDLFRESSDAPFVRTIVAEDAGIPVAAGVVSEASVHPQRLWAYIEVAKDHRNAGVGGTLLAMLRAEVAAALAGGLPGSAPGGEVSGAVTSDSPRLGGGRLRSKVVPGRPGAHFAASAGMAPIQRTRIIRIGAGALALEGISEQGQEKVEDLATGSVELTRALWEFYRAVHQWDPPAELGLGRVNQLFLGESAGARGAVVLRRNGAIEAFAVSYDRADTQAPADVLLGYRPGAARAQDSVRTLLGLLVARYPVELEVDDAMDAVRAVVDPLIDAGTAAVVRETHIVSDR